MNSAEILKSTELDTIPKNLISSDIDLFNKVKQVTELTGCSNDIALTTLFDSNYSIEMAIDKIFEQTQRQLIGDTNKANNDWKEVAKYKKKQSIEANPAEANTENVNEISEFKTVSDKLKSGHRGNGRGRVRFSQNNGRNNYTKTLQNNDKDDLGDSVPPIMYGNKTTISHGYNRRSQYRFSSSNQRGRPKHHRANVDNMLDESIDYEADRFNKYNHNLEVCNDWIPEINGKSNECSELDRSAFDNNYNCDETVSYHNLPKSALPMESFENKFVESCCTNTKKISSDLLSLSISKEIKSNQLNPLELVANCTSKNGIFGEFSRTKPPALSSKVPLEPVKLLTPTGVVTSNKTGFNFSFGFDFDEYFLKEAETVAVITNKSIVDPSKSFISKIMSTQQQDFEGIITSSSSNTKPVINTKESNHKTMEKEDYHQSIIFPESDSQMPPCISSRLSESNNDKNIVPIVISTSGSIPGTEIVRTSQVSPTEKKLLHNTNSVVSGYKILDNPHQSSINSAMLPTPSQLCAPTAHPHLLQQFQNNPQYFSLLNLPNGSSIFGGGCHMNHLNDFGDMVTTGPSDDINHQHHHQIVHIDPVASGSNKDFNHKASLNSKNNSVAQSLSMNSSSDNSNTPGTQHSSSTILPAVPMSNICCFPSVYMNNFTNFMPTVPSNHANQTQSVPDVTQSVVSNKSVYNFPTAATHRNYQLSEEYNDTNKFEELIPNKQKFQRSQNYGSNFSGVGINKSQEPADSLDIEKPVKHGNNGSGQIQRQQQPPNQASTMASSSNRTNHHHQQQQQPQPQQIQQSVSNDPRFMAFHHHQNHPYPNNIFNCVTATGAHSTAPHPYAMAHQGGSLQPLHPQIQLMQQQMHNFSPSYQFQEHLMTSMVSNATSRNNISQGSGSGSNQSRSNRSTNQLWHPSN